LKAKIYFSISLIYSFTIVVLSLANLKDVDLIKFNASDKTYHTICYALMAFLWSFYCFERLKVFKLTQKIILLLSVIGFGIIIEYLQLFLTDYRSFDWWDALANSVGAIIGLLIFSLIQKRFNLKLFDF
jgi:VanZ family protein